MAETNTIIKCCRPYPFHEHVPYTQNNNYCTLGLTFFRSFFSRTIKRQNLRKTNLKNICYCSALKLKPLAYSLMHSIKMFFDREKTQTYTVAPFLQTINISKFSQLYINIASHKTATLNFIKSAIVYEYIPNYLIFILISYINQMIPNTCVRLYNNYYSSEVYQDFLVDRF